MPTHARLSNNSIRNVFLDSYLAFGTGRAEAHLGARRKLRGARLGHGRRQEVPRGTPGHFDEITFHQQRASPKSGQPESHLLPT